jgi:hypothetical protein
MLAKTMKKGRQNTVRKPLLSAFLSRADVGKWSNPSPLQGGALQLRGFKSRRRLQLKAPVEAATSSRAVITTAEAAATRTHIIGILAVELKRRFHSDLPQLPLRMP